MRKFAIALVLACCLAAMGCNSTIKHISEEAWSSIKEIAKSEGTAAAEARIEQAKKELAEKGIDPEQIDSMAKLMLEYLKKRDSEKGTLDYELMLNLLIAYFGGSMLKRRLLPPPAPTA